MQFIADAFGNCRCKFKIADAIQNAHTPIITDGLMSLIEISLRRIAGLKNDARLMSLSGSELGKLTEGGFRPCQALQNYDSARSSARVKQISPSAPNPIRWEPRATFDLTDPVQF